MSDPFLRLDTGPLNKALARVAKAVGGDVIGRRLVPEAEKIMTTAKRNTPVDTGTLRSSGMVTARAKGVELSFGGAASAYAVIVHENLAAYHRVGKAKFLEDAINEWVAGGGMAALGRAIGKDLEGA